MNSGVLKLYSHQWCYPLVCVLLIMTANDQQIKIGERGDVSWPKWATFKAAYISWSVIYSPLVHLLRPLSLIPSEIKSMQAPRDYTSTHGQTSTEVIWHQVLEYVQTHPSPKGKSWHKCSNNSGRFYLVVWTMVNCNQRSTQIGATKNKSQCPVGAA